MTRFYVAVGSDRKGPFAPDELRTALRLQPDSLVWAQGMDEWTRAEQVPELAPALAEAAATAVANEPAGVAAPPDQPPPVPSRFGRVIVGGDDDFILLNPRLPRMAKALCAFVLVVNPALWVLGSLSCLTFRRWDDPSAADNALLVAEFVFSLAGLATAALLVYGGLKLRALRRAGVTILKAGFWADVALFAVAIVIMIAIGLASAAAPVDPAVVAPEGAVVTTPPPNAGDVVRWAVDAMALLAFGCEIVFLVWLIRRADRLPLE